MRTETGRFEFGNWNWRLAGHIALHLRGVCRHGLITRDRGRRGAYHGYAWTGRLGVVGMGTRRGTADQLARLADIRRHAAERLAQGR